MPSPVRIGIIGCGSVMRQAYLPQVQQLATAGLAELRLVCDTDPALATILGQQHGIWTFTTSSSAVISHPEIDLVVILTPPPWHEALARAALQAGKHVLVEKPLALNLEGATSLVDLARHSPGYLLPAPHIILSPTYRAIWRRLRAGDIGPVYLARGLYGHSGPGWAEWFFRAEAGGGPLFDLTVYNLTSLTGWLGPVRQVTAFMGTAIPQRLVAGRSILADAEDNLQLLLDFGGSTFASIASGFTIQSYRGASLELYGAAGTIRLLGDDWAPNGYEIWQSSTGAWQSQPETSPGWSYVSGIDHLVECIRAGKRPLITPEHAYHVLEVLLKAKEAARSGITQTVESAFPPLEFG
jgi:predicted dehydrogenase